MYSMPFCFFSASAKTSGLKADGSVFLPIVLGSCVLSVKRHAPQRRARKSTELCFERRNNALV